jgi:hypothetical protein
MSITCRISKSRFFGGMRRDRRQVFAQRLDRNLGKLAADVLHHPRQVFVREERENRVPRAHLPRAVVDGAERPRFGEHSRNVRAERGGARVAGLQMVEAPRQIRGQS